MRQAINLDFEVEESLPRESSKVKGSSYDCKGQLVSTTNNVMKYPSGSVVVELENIGTIGLPSIRCHCCGQTNAAHS